MNEYLTPNIPGVYTAAAPLHELHAADGLPLIFPQRLSLSEYKLYPITNPNGLVRPDAIRADAWGLTGECVQFMARVTRQRDVYTLCIKSAAPIDPDLLLAVADALRRAQPKEKAREYGRSREGRN